MLMKGTSSSYHLQKPTRRKLYSVCCGASDLRLRWHELTWSFRILVGHAKAHREGAGLQCGYRPQDDRLALPPTLAFSPRRFALRRGRIIGPMEGQSLCPSS